MKYIEKVEYWKLQYLLERKSVFYDPHERINILPFDPEPELPVFDVICDSI
jgi:hypothetical protein